MLASQNKLKFIWLHSPTFSHSVLELSLKSLNGLVFGYTGFITAILSVLSFTLLGWHCLCRDWEDPGVLIPIPMFFPVSMLCYFQLHGWFTYLLLVTQTKAVLLGSMFKEGSTYQKFQNVIWVKAQGLSLAYLIVVNMVNMRLIF